MAFTTITEQEHLVQISLNSGLRGFEAGGSELSTPQPHAVEGRGVEVGITIEGELIFFIRQSEQRYVWTKIASIVGVWLRER